MAPSARSRIVVPAKKSHVETALDFGGCDDGPLEASAVRPVGDIVGAWVTTAGVPVGAADGAVIGSATGELVSAAGERDVAGEMQTWLNRMDAGGAPKADV